ncbi:MAG: CPBP family intramembrane glutamic endopeptidase [Acidimicrobiales bacterium]
MARRGPDDVPGRLPVGGEGPPPGGMAGGGGGGMAGGGMAGGGMAGGMAGGRTASWGLGDALAGLVAAVAGSILTEGIYAAIAGSTRLTFGMFLADLLGVWVGFAGAPVAASYLKGQRSLAADFGLRLRLRVDAPLGIAVGVGAQLLVVPLLYLPFELLNPQLSRSLAKPAVQIASLASGPSYIALMAVVVLVVPPIEELFFRGLLLRSLERRIGGLAAIAVSALVFGLAHYEPLQLLGLVVFGVALAVLARWTGRLGAGIFAHAAFNATAMVALALAK